MKICYLLPLLGILYFDNTRAFKCHEGFNATIVGLPFYHWTERVCNGKSSCFSQEIKTRILRSDLEVNVRYGGCISPGYSRLISCGKLFGENSDLDPAVLFKMLPGLDDKFKAMAIDFEDNITESFRILFSDGTGTKSFIEGCYTFLTNVGFNMKKALPLKSHFVKLMNMSLPRPQRRISDAYPQPWQGSQSHEIPTGDYPQPRQGSGEIPNDDYSQSWQGAQSHEIPTGNYPELWQGSDEIPNDDYSQSWQGAQSYEIPTDDNPPPQNEAQPSIVDVDYPRSFEPETTENEGQPQLRPTDEYHRSVTPPESTEHKVDSRIEDFMNALGSLDTKEPAISSQIYSFIGNFVHPQAIKDFHNSLYSPFVNNLPGLIKSMLPESWQADKWFDVFFELLGNVNLRNPRQSTADVMRTMKKNVKIPQEYSEYLDPIMNRAPDLMENMAAGNYMYASHWSVKLLEDESTLSPATKRLSAALHRFSVSAFCGSPTEDVDLLITWAPGLYYKLFPGEKKEIDKIYNTISQGIEAIDFSRPYVTMKKTNMSDFITFMLDRTIFTTPESIKDRNSVSLVVINLSRVTYTILPDYDNKLDIIFTVLLEGFQTWPDIDLGKITERVITRLGYNIPRSLKPLLDHLQSLLMPTISDSDPLGEDAILDAIRQITNAYKIEYPTSEFPDIAWRIARYHNISSRGRPRDTCHELYELPNVNWTLVGNCYEKLNDVYKEFQLKMYDMAVDINVDFHFAVFNQIDSGDDTLYEEILKAFPDFKYYIQLMRLLDRRDVKQLYKDYMKWILRMSENQKETRFFSSIVWAFNTTVSKITSKLGDFTHELRQRFSPKSCKYDACTAALCNTHIGLTNVSESTPVNLATITGHADMEKVESNNTTNDGRKIDKAKDISNAGKVKHDPTVEPITTTSSSAQIYSSFIQIWLAMFLLGKFM